MVHVWCSQGNTDQALYSFNKERKMDKNRGRLGKVRTLQQLVLHSNPDKPWKDGSAQPQLGLSEETSGQAVKSLG